jgi:formylglycine-generating enzyme required for sulfatase activity
VALSADGKTLACGCQDGAVQIWDVPTKKLVFEGNAHQDTVDSVAFSPDGRWLASGGRDGEVRLWDRQYSVPTITNSIGMKLATIPAGEFLMGTKLQYQDRSGYRYADSTPERPRHPVKISRAFRMSIHEVTVAQFRAFVDATGFQTTAEATGKGGEHLVSANYQFQTRPEFTWRSPGYQQDDDHPAVHITYDDAQSFCRWLSKKEGKTYRLPTEAEWEYACRAGSTREFGFTDHPALLERMGNVPDAALEAALGGSYPVAANWTDGAAFTAPVGSYIPNAFGLYDMLGNAFEWCQDWYDPAYYSLSPASDPPGPATGAKRVQRGGGFSHHAFHARPGARDFEQPDKPQSNVGFRVVMEEDN